MSSSTLTHSASAKLHSSQHKTSYILPTFQDESVQLESAPKQRDVHQLMPLSIRARGWSLKCMHLFSSRVITCGIEIHK